MQQSHSVTVTLNNPTQGQLLALNDILHAADAANAEKPAKVTKGKAGKPKASVSPDEEEDFGTKAVDEEELEEESEDSDDAEEDEDAEESDEEEDDALTFDEVKAALNKYGNKNPDGAKAILLGFNIKTTAELQKHKTKWEPVYRKLMARIKAAKKKKAA